jgi:hypothetical protein
MQPKSNTRPNWVWAAIGLQFVIAMSLAYGSVQGIGSLREYMTTSLVWQLVTREYIPTLLAVAALPGLWRHLVFYGPIVLCQIWWLAVPIGVFTALVCSAMHPWAFAAQLNLKRFMKLR